MSSNPQSKQPLQWDQDSNATLNSQNVQPDSYLHPSFIPPLNIRRSSQASVFSDITDLDHMSNEHNVGLLNRTISNLSNVSTYSNPDPVSIRQRLRNLYNQNYGALLVLMSQVFGVGMNITTRLLEHDGSHGGAMHPFQILFTRQFLTALLCTVYAVTTKSIPHFPLGPPDRKVRILLVCRGLFGFFGVFGLYFSLLYLPLSEATVMTFLAPILTCYICSLLLPGETFSRQQQIAGLVSFVGVIFIAKPTTLFSALLHSPPTTPAIDGNIAPSNGTTSSNPFVDTDPTQPTPAQHLLAIGVAMIGVCGATGAMTSIRAIGTRAHAFISVNYFSVWSTIVSLFALIVFPDVTFRLPANITEWALLFSLGLCGFCMQGLLTMGLAYGGPATSPSSIKHPTVPQSTTDTNTTMLGSKALPNDIEMQTQLIHSPDFSSTPSSSNMHQTPDPSHHHHHHSRPAPPKPSGNRATSMVYCQMLFALAADKLIFGTTMGVFSWIGSGLILTGAIWVAAAADGRKSTKTHDVGQPVRRREGGKGQTIEESESEEGRLLGSIQGVSEEEGEEQHGGANRSRSRNESGSGMIDELPSSSSSTSSSSDRLSGEERRLSGREPRRW